MSAKKITLPEVFYDTSGSYWLKLTETRYLPLSANDVKMHFRRAGFRTDTEDEETGLKAGDRILVNAQIDRYVDYAGPLAGHRVGMFKTPADKRVLVTHQAATVEPAKSADCPFIQHFLGDLFGKEQLPHVLSWLKISYESLRVGDFRPGQLLVLAGPPGCGKSFFQQLVTLILGGRSANPYLYMTGGTPFNSELCKAEHLVIEDALSSSTIAARRAFGAQIKGFLVVTDKSLHGKGREAIQLPTFCRMSISLNLESENFMVLPPLDESLADKISLLKCSPARLHEDRKKNSENLTKELPNFLALLGRWKIERGMRCPRYGARAYHNPEILEALSELAPETRLEQLMDAIIKERPWSGSAEELEKEMRQSEFSVQVQNLFYFSSACGTYLSRLHAKKPAQYVKTKSNGKTRWTITEQEK